MSKAFWRLRVGLGWALWFVVAVLFGIANVASD